MPAVYKEACAWAWGFEQCLPLVRSLSQMLYTMTDSLPVAWMRKGTGRRAMSQFRLAGFDDIKWEVLYISGPRNVQADALSRPPLLGPLKLMVDGVLSMVKAGFDLLPHSNYRNIYVHADDDTKRVSALVRDLRYVRVWQDHQRWAGQGRSLAPTPWREQQGHLVRPGCGLPSGGVRSCRVWRPAST